MPQTLTTSATIQARMPPQNLEAEAALLGSILIDGEALVRVADFVTADDYYTETHRKIFEACLELYAKHDPIDVLSLGNRLEEKGSIEAVGGRAYLVSLTNTVATAAHVVHYAHIVHKKATLRRLLAAASDILQLGHNEDEDIEVVLDRAAQTLYGVSERLLRQAFIPVSDVLAEAFERIDELHRERGKLRGIPTGFSDLDNLLAGFQQSDLIVVAARPSVGKTSFILDIARNVATRAKVPVGIFSLEMSKEQLTDRLICAEAGVDLWRMRTGRLAERGEENDFSRIGHALGILAESPIYIDDSATNTVMQIRTKARRLRAEKNLGLLMVDYLQLMETRTKIENRVQEIAEITRSLKGIARELGIPVVAVSQLSRAVEMSKPAIPKLAHLRESGSIEQDADVVVFIYRKTADRNYRLEDIPPDERNVAEIHVAKHRNGPTGVVHMYFDAARTSFRNLERGMGRPPLQGE